MNRSVSEPSLGNSLGASTGPGTSRGSHITFQSKIKKKHEVYRGAQLWEGRFGKVTKVIVKAPWNIWFQSLVQVAVIYQYILHFLIAYYLKKKWHLLDLTIAFTDLIYFADVFVHILHAYWPLLRQHMRVYRRHFILLALDILSLLPVNLMFKYKSGFKKVILIGRWLSICRIYRIFIFFRGLNDSLRTSRKLLYILEHLVIVNLILHAATCLWYNLNKSSNSTQKWYNLGYPAHVNDKKVEFNRYESCWYYCSCRFFNVIFGDTFPLESTEKWLTSFLMLVGYVFVRYQFIGALAWEYVLQNRRMAMFIDRVHHMTRYLNFLGAPASLVDQAVKYKLQLWQMKDGIVTSDHLKELPQPLQMELIFDINVSHFHNSLLFRDTEEAFMRKISLLMKHEIFLAGQHVWSQGVVKSGMICIKRGVIEMLSDEDDESPMIAFKDGTVLGELSLFYSIPSKVTVKAATYVEVQVLRRTDLMRVISEHPFMLEHIRGTIAQRLQKAIRKQNAITNYDKSDSRLLRTRYRPMKVLKDHLAGVEEEDPTFVDDSHLYYRDENNERQPKFVLDYLELYRITSNVTTIEAPRICLRSTFPWILEPNTDFTHMFDMAHFAMVLYVCIMSPYSAINSSESDGEKVLGTVVMAGLLLNIYVQLTTAIVDKNSRKETVKEIAEVKIGSFGFYLDIISVFPVYIFTDTLDPYMETVSGQIARVFPVLQVWHLWDYLRKWAKSFDSHVKLLGLVEFLMIIFLGSYWSGCILYLVACPRKICQKNSWMSLLIYWETKVFFTIDAKHERPLLTSYAYGTSVFVGTGMVDLSPGASDIIVVVLLLALGSYLSCIYIAKICSMYLLSSERKLKFKDSMRELFYFLTVNHVSGKIKSRVKNFFVVQWYYNNAVSTKELFEDMSANIKQEVLCLEMVQILLQCPLFQQCNRDFLQTVASNTRTIVLPDNEIVQHAADIGREMYILQRGHCNLLNHQAKVHDSVGPGSYFGVVEMLFGLPKVYTVVTTTNCILVHVEYSALVQCWGTFPDISHPIMTALLDLELLVMAKQFEEAKHLTGKFDVKVNRIKQEIKESFVVLSGRDRERFVKAFDVLGVMRYIRYIFLPGCITPHGLFLKFWCAVRFALAIFYIIVVPYDIATKQNKHRGGYTWVDIVLYIDVVLMSYVAYYNDKSLLITHPLLTVTRYMKHALLLDILSIFPFEQVVCIVNDTTDLDIYRMNRILLVTRITGAFSYWESDIMRVNPVVVLLKFLPLAVTFINFATAIIFMHSCEPFLPRDSQFIMVNCTRTLMVSNSITHTKYAAIEYSYTFYWVYEIFVGLGCTPVATANSVDPWLIMALQIVGTLYFAFMFGYVASTRSAAAHALLEHTEKTTDLANFLYQQNIDPMLTTKTLKYFEYVWRRTNGSNPQKICRCLNSALMEDTLVFMYERALREVPLFGKVERSFIRVITQHLNEMYFVKGDTVVQCRDVQYNIYIIYRGKVDVLSSYNEMITCMGPGGMFGNFSGQTASCSEVSIYASRSLDLLAIPTTVFFNLIKYYPKVQEPLNKAFEVSRDYILPITMDLNDNTDSEDSEMDINSLESGFDSRSGSTRIEVAGQVSISSARSHSNLSQAKSSTSTLTLQGHTHVSNLLRPGTMLFQIFGYSTCIMATVNYMVVLYALVTLNDCFAIFWLQALFDVFFHFKTFLTMYQGYVSNQGDLIIDAARCRRRYYKHKWWFWTDFFANIPLEMMGLCFTLPLRAMHYLRINKLLRVKYLIEFYRKTSSELTNNLTILQAVMTMLIVVLLIHTFTCTWLLALTATNPFSRIRTLKLHVIDEETPQERWDYSTSFYVVVSALSTTGGDELVIDDLTPMIILGIIFSCGKMLAAIVIAAVIQVAYSSKYALNQYERTTNELIDILKNQGLSKYQLQKFWKYVRQLWVTERGRQLPVLLSQTPYVRRCDLMSAIFGHHLRNCYLFADTGEPFLRQLTVAMDYMKFFPGNYIVMAGDSEACMYWVASGTVSVVSVRPDLTETTHELLGPGDVFGILQGINRGIMHCFSYRAETKVSVLILSLDSWINILPFFPDAKQIIAERSEVLFAQI